MNKITELRKGFKYSQSQLAEILNVSQSAVSQWELGKAFPDILTAQKLALVFGVAIEDLITDSTYISYMPISKIRVRCSRLNDEGLQKVLSYAEDLIATGKYDRMPVMPSEAAENGDC